MSAGKGLRQLSLLNDLLKLDQRQVSVGESGQRALITPQRSDGVEAADVSLKANSIVALGFPRCAREKRKLSRLARPGHAQQNLDNKQPALEVHADDNISFPLFPP